MAGRTASSGYARSRPLECILIALQVARGCVPLCCMVPLGHESIDRWVRRWATRVLERDAARTSITVSSRSCSTRGLGNQLIVVMRMSCFT